MDMEQSGTARGAPSLQHSLKLNAERGFAFLVDESGEPGLAVLQGGKIGLRSAMGEIGADQQSTSAQQPAQFLEQRPRRRKAVEKGKVVAGVEPSEHLREVALM